MSTSLYQKYRPQLFSEVVGQQHIRTTLLNELRNKSTAHAYLFSGPRGTGKTTTARLLARALNCSALRDGEPCQECTSCQLIQQGKALDVIEIDAASHTGVDHVRENIIENARVTPSVLQRKVFIIDEVHMLSISSFNALLKTLEEPPSHTVFILATTELHKVPATIVSRCERFAFRKVTTDDIVQRLSGIAAKEGVVVEPAVLELIARRADGGLRDAESVFGQVLSLGEKNITVETASLVLPQSQTEEMVGLLQELSQKQAQEAITRLHRLMDEGVMLTEFMKEWIEFMRRVLLFQVYQSPDVLGVFHFTTEQLDVVKAVVKKNTVPELARMIEVSIRAFEQMKTVFMPQLPLELAMVELCYGSAQPAAAPVAAAQAQAVVPPPAAPTPPGVMIKKKTVTQRQTVEVKTEDVTVQTGPVRVSTLEELQQQWTAVLQEMKRQNHALHLTFQVGKLVAFDGTALTLGFEYQFYQDRLYDARNLPVIDSVFTQVIGAPVKMNIVVGPQYGLEVKNDSQNIKNVQEPSEEEVANVWELAEQAFGAQIDKTA